jgi:hypothetical protein
MHANIRPNNHSFDHNRPSWVVEVFDEDGRLEYCNNVLTANLPRQFTQQEQMIAALGKYTAHPSDVLRDGDGFRVTNLRRL